VPLNIETLVRSNNKLASLIKATLKRFSKSTFISLSLKQNVSNKTADVKGPFISKLKSRLPGRNQRSTRRGNPCSTNQVRSLKTLQNSKALKPT
jgi:hypothetical protein